MRHLVDFINHAHFVEHLFDALFSVFLVFPACCLEYEFKVLANGAVVEQLEILKDDSQFLAQSRNLLSPDSLEVSAENFQPSRFRPLQRSSSQ